MRQLSKPVSPESGNPAGGTLAVIPQNHHFPNAPKNRTLTYNDNNNTLFSVMDLQRKKQQKRLESKLKTI